MFNTHIFKKQNNNSNAFTIIELLVVIAIIGLISSVVLVSMRGSTGKAKIAKGLEFSQTIMNTIGHDAVGVWTFDEGSGGTAHDKSGYKNHGTLVGPPTWVDGEENTPHWFVNEGDGRSALEFDGISDYLGLNESITLNRNGATLSWWMKAGSTSSTGLFSKITGSSWVSHIESRTNSIFAETDTNCNNFNFNNVKKSTKWTHYTIIFDNAKAYLYVNGKHFGEAISYGSTACSGPGASEMVNDTTLQYMGTYGYSPRFNGLLDEIRIYERALGSAEIQQHYADGAEKYELAISNNK